MHLLHRLCRGCDPRRRNARPLVNRSSGPHRTKLAMRPRHDGERSRCTLHYAYAMRRPRPAWLRFKFPVEFGSSGARAGDTKDT
eukprot:6193207-Pleurochrysis_carterae.AAC.2